MPPTQSGRRLGMASGARTRLRPAGLPSNNVGLNLSSSLLSKDQPYRVKKAKHEQSIQGRAGATRRPISKPIYQKYSQRLGYIGFLLMTANQTLHHEKTPLLKATSILNGIPILMSRKIASHNPEIKLHTLDIVSLELLSANKKTQPLKSTLTQTNTLSSIREQNHEYNAPLSPLTSIRPVPRRDSEDSAAQLLTAVNGYLGNEVFLPPFDDHRAYMHYIDNKLSPEEQIAKFARYAYTPTKVTDALKAKRYSVLKLRMDEGVNVAFEDNHGGKTPRKG